MTDGSRTGNVLGKSATVRTRIVPVAKGTALCPVRVFLRAHAFQRDGPVDIWKNSEYSNGFWLSPDTLNKISSRTLCVTCRIT